MKYRKGDVVSQTYDKNHGNLTIVERNLMYAHNVYTVIDSHGVERYYMDRLFDKLISRAKPKVSHFPKWW